MATTVKSSKTDEPTDGGKQAFQQRLAVSALKADVGFSSKQS